MALACLYGRCLGGNLCQIYSSRGESGPMSHFSDYSPSQKSTIMEPPNRLITGMNLIGCVFFSADFFNSTRDGSSVPVVRDA